MEYDFDLILQAPHVRTDMTMWNNVHFAQEQSWQGGYQQAHTQQDGWWNAEIAMKADRLKVVSAQPHEARTEGQLSAGPFRASFRDTWDYDGTMRVDLTLQPTEGKAIEALTLEIPFLGDAATLMHANSDRIRAPVAQKIPDGNGAVWDARKVACDDYRAVAKGNGRGEIKVVPAAGIWGLRDLAKRTFVMMNSSLT